MIYKKGEYILLTEGEYSDYGINAFGIVIKDFDMNEIEKEYFIKYPEDKEEYNGNEERVVNFLINEKKVIKELNKRELHLGAYGNIKFRDFS